MGGHATTMAPAPIRAADGLSSLRGCPVSQYFPARGEA